MALCVQGEKGGAVYREGIEAKLAWTRNGIREGRSFAQIAYVEDEPAGLLHYEIIPEQVLVRILCIFVPERRFWGKGIGTELLSSLAEEMRRAKVGVESRPP